MYIIYFFVCLIACFIGAISGIGGGIIIKPILDMFGKMGASELSFLSGCTVLTMSLVSLIRARKNGIELNFKIGLFIAIGSGIGGILGKNLFQLFLEKYSNSQMGFFQSIILFLINVFILIYIKNKYRIKSFSIKNNLVSLICGIILGLISSFLGIGGGPLNIALLYILFSMPAKEIVICSLFIVFISQSTSLITTAFNGIPSINKLVLFAMCFGGVFGALIGGSVAKKMDNKKTESFFSKVLIFLIFLNIYNIIKFYISL